MGKCLSSPGSDNDYSSVIEPVQNKKFEIHSTKVTREIFEKKYDLPYAFEWLPLDIKQDQISRLWLKFINCKNKGYNPTKPEECVINVIKNATNIKLESTIRNGVITKYLKKNWDYNQPGFEEHILKLCFDNCVENAPKNKAVKRTKEELKKAAGKIWTEYIDKEYHRNNPFDMDRPWSVGLDV